MSTSLRFVVGDGNRYCGRYMAASSSTITYAAAAVTTICTANTPFRMKVRAGPQGGA